MQIEQWVISIELCITLVVFVFTIAGLLWFQSKPALVFAFSLLVLYTGNIVDTQQLLDSGANQGLLTLILLMLCSLALEKKPLFTGGSQQGH
jgi:hypothetical protein